MSAFDEFLAAQPGAPQAGARNVKLLCVTTVDGVRISDVLNVDYAAHTVNGRKAIFGQDEITFETPPDPGRQGRPTIHKLNRYDGSFYSYQEGALYPSPPPRLTCTVAPQRAF